MRKHFAFVVLIMILALSGLAFAATQQPGEIPFIDLLPHEVLVFGASGGVIVTLLLSILKYFRIVGKEGVIPTQAANFILSVLVAAIAGVLSGQTFLVAVGSALASIVTASGLHETAGHAAIRLVEKVTGKE